MIYVGGRIHAMLNNTFVMSVAQEVFCASREIRRVGGSSVGGVVAGRCAQGSRSHAAMAASAVHVDEHIRVLSSF